MNALELADKLDETWYRWQGHKITELEASDTLRRQHEAIKVLREALGNISSYVGKSNPPSNIWANAQKALKDTEGL